MWINENNGIWTCVIKSKHENGTRYAKNSYIDPQFGTVLLPKSLQFSQNVEAFKNYYSLYMYSLFDMDIITWLYTYIYVVFLIYTHIYVV